jgi:hypothetical protein
MKRICRILAPTVVVLLFPQIGRCAEPLWGIKGSTVWNCINSGNIGVPAGQCKLVSGPAAAPANAVITGVFLLAPPSTNLVSYEIDLSHQGVTAVVAKNGVYDTEGAPQAGFNGLLVQGDGGVWTYKINNIKVETQDRVWGMDFVFEVSWEVMPRFKTSFIGKPAVLVAGTSTQVFAKTTDGRLVEAYRPYYGATWTMYDRSSEADSYYVQGDPVAQTIGTMTYVYVGGWLGPNNKLLQWSTPDASTWQVTDLSTAYGSQPIMTNSPVVSSSHQIFAISTSGRLLQWVQEDPACPAAGPGAANCWRVWDLSGGPGAVPVQGKPALVESPGSLHIYVQSENAELIEWYKESNPAPWQIYNLSSAPGAKPIFGSPAAIMIGNTMQVFAFANTETNMVQWYKEPNPAPWQVFDLPGCPAGPASEGSPSVIFNGATSVFSICFDPPQLTSLLAWYKEPNPAPWTVFDTSAQAGGVYVISDVAPLFDVPTSTLSLYAVRLDHQLVEFHRAPNPAPLIANTITGF